MTSHPILAHVEPQHSIILGRVSIGARLSTCALRAVSPLQDLRYNPNTVSRLLGSRQWAREMRVLCVAEKPSIAKNITQILAGGRFETVSALQRLRTALVGADTLQRQSGNQYVRNYDFAYRLPPPLGGAGDADFTVTAVLGHLTSTVSFTPWHGRPR